MTTLITRILKDITTTKDGESFDVARVVITVNSVILIPVLIVGIAFYLWGWICRPDHPFNIQEFFTAILTFEGSVAALLTSGAASIAWKKSTEPNGMSSESLTMTKDLQPPPVEVNQTNIKVQ